MTSNPSDPTHDQAAVAAALKAHPVLGRLDAATRHDLQARLGLERFTAGQTVAEGGALSRRPGLLVQGRIGLHEAAPSAPAAVVLSAPDWFGAGVMWHGALGDWRAVADGEALVAFWPPGQLAALREQHAWLGLYIQPSSLAVTPESSESTDAQLTLMQTPVRSLIKRPPITLPPQTSIHDAAVTMREHRVSSVLLVDGGQLRGLVTDRDLRNRALAAGLDPSRPLIDIATLSPTTLDIGQPAFQALLLMARHNIHHVPVMDGDAVAGMITTTDVTDQHSTSPVFLAGDIHKQTTLAGLVACAAKVRGLQKHLSAGGASAHATGHIITAITDALTSRLLNLGEQQFGPPPVPFAWVAAGSQARSEQTAKSDQDNCMILDDAYDPAAHGAYFKDLATWVCDGLHACGYVHCPGEMMAMTDQWRQPRRVWAQYFRKWIDTPEPKALMLTCVFFDVRTVAGEHQLLDGLRREVLKKTRDNRLFLAHMVGNALSRQPPLGLFGRLSTQRSGEHKGTIDLKHKGIVPVIDLARVYALAAGHDAVNTHDRLAHAADSGEISPGSVRDLEDALDFLASLRIRHQAQQIAAGHDADNYLRPADLSNFEREQLKDAFGVVKQLQDVLAQRYRSA
jgi:CBS domain-containing protein